MNLLYVNELNYNRLHPVSIHMSSQQQNHKKWFFVIDIVVRHKNISTSYIFSKQKTTTIRKKMKMRLEKVHTCVKNIMITIYEHKYELVGKSSRVCLWENNNPEGVVSQQLHKNNNYFNERLSKRCILVLQQELLEVINFVQKT